MPRKNTTKLKLELIAQFGGACQRCGYNRCLRALHFHHLDPSEKYEWSRGNASFDEVATHPDRFQVVCANCHAEIHDEEVIANRQFVPCLQCGTPVKQEPNRVANGRDRYCSRACQHLHRPVKAVEIEEQRKRLYRHIEKTDGCWHWDGYRADGGYGMTYYVHPDGHRQECTAQRLSYIVHHGPISSKSRVYRTCDTSNCVNPEHLYIRS